MKAMPDSSAGGVGRVIALLTLLAERPDGGLSIRDAARLSNISRSAVHRILSQLAELGVAETTSDGRYVAGPALFELATKLVNKSSMLEVADRVMRSLVDDIGETVCLTQFVPLEPRVVFLHAVKCNRAVQYVVPVGASAPLHAGAAGKAVLAWLPSHVLTSLSLTPLTANTPTDLEELTRELAAIRERGYAVSVGERFVEAVGVAAPLFSDAGVIGSLTITLPRSRFEDSMLPRLADRIRGSAEDLTKHLRNRRLSDVGEVAR